MAFVSLDLNPNRRMLRSFGFIGLFAFSGLAAMASYRWLLFKGLSINAAETTRWVFAALAAYSGLFALLAPPLLRPLYVVLTVAAYPIGLVMSYVIVGIMFFLVITPMALVFKLIGRDAMNRRFEPGAPSYWIVRHPPKSVARYFRQF